MNAPNLNLNFTARHAQLMADFTARHAQLMADFTAQLGKSRFWYVLPTGKTRAEDAESLLDAENGLRYKTAQIEALSAFLEKHLFLYLRVQGSNTVLATLHTATGLLWCRDSSKNDGESAKLNLADGKRLVQQARWAGLEGWQLPTPDQIKAFAMDPSNPHRAGPRYLLAYSNNQSPAYQWLTEQGCIDTESGCWDVVGNHGFIFACHTFGIWQVGMNERLLLLLERGWQLVAPSGEAHQLKGQNLQGEALWKQLTTESFTLLALDGKTALNPAHDHIAALLSELDLTPCRLPPLDRARLTDPEKGLWELWGEPPEFLNQMGLVARDPGQDVQRRAVAIDFGTSSTVVAMDTASGGRELLRIGVRDFYQEVQPQHFENPTVLECLDFSAFESAWTQRAYRPELDWSWMRAAHEAQASFRDNPGDTQILASILPRLKQWALRSERSRVRLTDRKQREIELAAHTERNPVRGQALSVGADYPFDPIELYAWYLGMAINWRERGIFLKYYLSFPVKYPREVKNSILASFRRGLQRSLPQTLIDHHPQVLNDFEVNEWASEPAAYAAAAMVHLGIDPTDEGVPYAVFDFGGGTTDFDFGLLRWATDEEEHRGYEQVFEHLASEGDTYLGGENLLEHLVYASFQHNLGVLRTHRIQFTKPLDAAPFVGSEAFLAPTQAAQTNTVMLAAKLRPFLESETPDLPPQFKLDLIDANGNKQACELVFDATALDSLLASRIRGGALAFFAQLAQLHPDLPKGAPIHILLAGNGSRSRHVKALFDDQGEMWRELLSQTFGDTPPAMVVHPPLPMDESNPHAPTTKTGVALGLLHLKPGENTLLLDHVHQRHDGQAPFAWFVGRTRRRQFEPALNPGADYGQWQEIGLLQHGVFNLYTTVSPRARAGLSEGDPELKKLRLDFAAAPAEARVFARPVGPHKLELTAAINDEDLENSSITALVLE